MFRNRHKTALKKTSGPFLIVSRKAAGPRLRHRTSPDRPAPSPGFHHSGTYSPVRRYRCPPKSLRQTVFRNNGKFALQHDTGIDYGMTVHRQPFTGSDRNPKNRNTGRSRRIRRQRRAVPTLGSIDDRRGTGPCLAGVRRHNSARFSDRIAAQLPQRIPGHYFRFFLRITSSISSVMLDRSHSGFQPHSSRAQVSSSELGQLSAMAFFTGSTS